MQYQNRMPLHWLVMILCLFPVIAQSWPPNAEEFRALCRQSQWEEDAVPLLAEPDETIRQWLGQPMDSWGDTPIHICAEEGNQSLLHQLLLRVQLENRLPLLVAANSCGSTPLHLAALHGHLPVARCLLGHGASVTAVNTLGSTPLHLAAYCGQLPVVQYLLENRAAVTAVNTQCNTPLHLAGLRGHLPVVQYLLAHGASVTAANIYGNTPLHGAALYGHLPEVRCLLEYGASVTAVNKEGGTPLDLATKCNHQPVIALLTDQPIPDVTPGWLQSLAVLFTVLGFSHQQNSPDHLKNE